ncbi:6-O-methylguanine DNA methyltransferase [Streptomyces pluripotens]|uniref:6-O-methylguanine DNA methyltransferase n=2 Tax=Streptomyces TaxID=1883 RepID=A0A221P2J2_9ACTN|nr:6-O-methylguanine DNA methyltransferase [Streptomyces pluripotens]ASN26451.1 6-O-methylguanine DNA methyltransferase [Streptomyces pluripotens]MCH0556069.1 MGMT family protein [Streptomyces sp. MUM 16J]
MRGRTVCRKCTPGARGAGCARHAAVSAGCGRMGRMSEQRSAGEIREEGDAYEDALPEYAERVLQVAERIPPGWVMTYGDVAEWLGEGGPRQVGRVMALYGGAVPWWRVVRADGVLLPGHALRALAHYREEDTPLREASRQAEGHLPRLDLRRARWDGGADAEGHT